MRTRQGESPVEVAVAREYTVETGDREDAQDVGSGNHQPPPARTPLCAAARACKPDESQKCVWLMLIISTGNTASF